MKNRNLILTILLALIVLSSCQTKTKYNTVNVDDMFTIEVPTYMKEMDLGNPDAAYTAGDSLLERYLMVIYETKKEIESYHLDVELTHEYYGELVVDMFAQAFTNPSVELLNKTTEEINGIPAYHYRVVGVLAEVGIEMYSSVTVYESDKSFYTIYAWSFITDERLFSKHTKYMANSFKEI
ncbi:MAG TPA: hypothetical protein EYG85_07900 [Crocinitomix sp.]|nr:hypothetical protein [Crocinitomix sp.]